MKKSFLLLFIIILSLSLFISCTPTVSPPTPSEGEGEGEEEPTGDRVVLMELFNADGCSASAVINPIAEDLAQQYGTDKVILLEEAGWGKYSTTETMERFDWYVPGTKHTPFIAFNGLSQTFSEGIVDGGGGGGGSTPSVNHAPVISSLIADSENICVNGSTVITCNATDQDGDSLNYTWTKTAGIITGSGKIVSWNAPATTDTYTITCTADDGKGKQDSESVDIDVSDSVTGVLAVAVTYHSTSRENMQLKLDELFKKNKSKNTFHLKESRNISRGDINYDVGIAWDEYIGSTTYKIYKKVNAGTFSLIANPNVTAGEGYYEYLDTNVSPGNTYTYYVTAMIIALETSPSRYATCYHLPSCSLSSPTDGSTISKPHQTFSWSPVGINSFPNGPISAAESELYVRDLTNAQTVWWPFFDDLTTSSANYNQDGQANIIGNPGVMVTMRMVILMLYR